MAAPGPGPDDDDGDHAPDGRYVAGDVGRLPLAADSVDAVWACASLSTSRRPTCGTRRRSSDAYSGPTGCCSRR